MGYEQIDARWEGWVRDNEPDRRRWWVKLWEYLWAIDPNDWRYR